MFLSISDTFQPLYANETIIVYMFTTVNTLLFVFNVQLCADAYTAAHHAHSHKLIITMQCSPIEPLLRISAYTEQKPQTKILLP